MTAAAATLQPTRAALADALAVVCGGCPRLWDALRHNRVTRIECGADGIVPVVFGERLGAVPWKTTDPRAAWKQLATAGVIPGGWVEDPRRAFAREIDEPMVRGYAAQPHPPTLAMCVALASDVPGVLAAEMLAREAVARLAPWGVPQPQRATWRLVDVAVVPPSYAYDHPWFLNRPTSALVRNGSRGWVTTRSEMPRAAWGNAHETARLLRGDWKTQGAAGRRVAPAREYAGARITAVGDAPRALWKTRLRDLPNPFEPVVGVWETGYALHEITEQAAVLVAPAL